MRLCLLVKAILGQGIGGAWWHPADAREDVVPGAGFREFQGSVTDS